MWRILLIVLAILLGCAALIFLIALIDELLVKLGWKRPYELVKPLPPSYGMTTCVNCGAPVGTGSPGCGKCGAHM